MTPAEAKALAAEAEALANAATPGPWDADETGVVTLHPDGFLGPVLAAHDGLTEPVNGIGSVGDSYPRGINRPTENMKFIAYARAAVPALATALREMASQVEVAERGWLETSAALADNERTIALLFRRLPAPVTDTQGVGE